MKKLILLPLLFAVLLAQESNQITVQIDSFEKSEMVTEQDAQAFQDALIRAIAEQGRFDIITPETLAERLKARTMELAGMAMDDASKLEASKALGTKYIIRLKVSRVKRGTYAFSENIDKRKLTANVIIRVLAVDTATAQGSLAYTLEAEEGALPKDYDSLLLQAASSMAGRLSYDIKDLLPLQAGVSDYSLAKVELDAGKNLGITKNMRFKIYNTQKLAFEDEFGEVIETPIYLPIGDVRVIDVGEEQATARVRNLESSFEEPITALEWNIRNSFFEMSFGLNTFNPVLESKTLYSTNFDAGADDPYTINLFGTSDENLQAGRLELGDSLLTPFFHMDFGRAKGFIHPFMRVGVNLPSPLVEVSFEPGLKLMLVEKGFFNLQLGGTIRFAAIGGNIGNIEVLDPAPDYNQVNSKVFGADLPTGTEVRIRDFYLGGAVFTHLGFNLNSSFRGSLTLGYEMAGELEPEYSLEVPETIGNSDDSPIEEIDEKIFGYDDPISLNRLYFGINFSYLY